MQTDISILETYICRIYQNKNEENQYFCYLIVYAIEDTWQELGEGILHKCLQSYAHLLPFDKKMHQNCFGDGYEGRRSF